MRSSQRQLPLLLGLAGPSLLPMHPIHPAFPPPTLCYLLPSIHPSIHPSIQLSVHPSTHPPINPCTQPAVSPHFPSEEQNNKRRHTKSGQTNHYLTCEGTTECGQLHTVPIETGAPRVTCSENGNTSEHEWIDTTTMSSLRFHPYLLHLFLFLTAVADRRQHNNHAFLPC